MFYNEGNLDSIFKLISSCEQNDELLKGMYLYKGFAEYDKGRFEEAITGNFVTGILYEL